MNSSPSYDDLAAWDDLNIILPDADLDDPHDPRRMYASRSYPSYRL